jgi:hypothetical protein
VVPTVKLALDWPNAMVTVAGTVAAGLLLDSDTTTPPAAALPLSITVPIDGFPPITLFGLRVTDARDAGPIVRVAVFETLPSEAEITAVV